MKMDYMRLVLGAALITTMTGTAFAEAPEDKWQFGVTVPIWAAGIDGDVTVRGNTADLDIGFDDLLDHLDASFSLGLEARKDKFGLYTGFGYMKFSGEGSRPGGARSEAEFTLLIADAGVSYRLVNTGGERPFILEGTAGVRYWATETDLELRGPGGGVLFEGGDDNDLIDPAIGLRGSYYFGEKWHFDFQGDIGGFGISDDTSDLTWSAGGMISYDMARWFTLSAGYKALTLDVESGSGASRNGIDIMMHGLLLAAKFTF